MPTHDMKRKVCDTCGRRRKVRYSNIARTFCSTECANKYLESEGFCHRVVDPKQSTTGKGVTNANP